MATDDKLYKARTSKRSQLTRKVNELRRLVVENRRSEVLLKYDLVKGAFHEFEQAHLAYHDTLSEDKDLLMSDAYFEEVEGKYIDGLGDVYQYIKDGEKPKQSADITPTAQAEQKTVSVVKLPPAPHPDVFTGKAESYPMWKASFNTLVGKHNIGYDEKMYYLKQYTSGEAQSAIEALFLCPDKTSYDSALEILEDRFGNPSLVASAFRKKLESWPKLGDQDGKALQKFSDFLKQICIVKKSYKSLEILSDEFENRKMLKKLPTWLVKQWIEEVVESETFPDFDRFSSFISDKAKIENHALWEGHSHILNSSGAKPHIKVTSQAESVQNKGHALQTDAACAQASAKDTSSSTTNRETNPRPKSCPVCKNDHKAVSCPVFADMSLADRKLTIRNKNMCFGCLNPGHHSGECRNRHTCEVCSKRHPTLLHDYTLGQPVHVTSMLLDTKGHDRATTMVLPVILRHPSSDKEILVYALLDTQSNTNFVTSEVANMIGVLGQRTSLELTTMSGRTKIPTERVDGLEIRGVSEDAYVKISPCFTRDTIPCNRANIPTAETLEKWPHLTQVELPPYYEDAPIGLLIGYHCSQAMRPLDVVPGGEHEPFGWRTSLGWCVVGVTQEADLTGCVDEIGTSHAVHGCIALRTVCREVMCDVSDVDAFSQTMPGMDEQYSADDVQFMKIMSSQMIQREDKHYEAPLPLKAEHVFPLNKCVAQRRLSGLRSKFERDSEYHRKYKDVINEMVEMGFAEIVPQGEYTTVGRTWYIPHHGVQQGAKLRVVFDCSSKFQGVSLNERLLQGPNLLNHLLGILFRFRLESVALTCDIQKMYHQFMVSDKDRDLLRFLWWENGDVSKDPVDHRMRVHLFGATSSPGVATFALRKIASDHAEKHAVEASQFVDKDFYVDDGVTSVPTAENACSLFCETQGLLAEGALKCHKVMSNSQEVLDGVPEEDRATLDDSKLHKTLGVLWNVETDVLQFPLDFDRSKLTRRCLLSNMSKIFDPLGVIAPILHQGKLILHEMCREHYEWDQQLSGPLLQKCVEWCDLLERIGEVVVPRQVSSCESAHTLELHHFADASSTGYAACSYLRCIDGQGMCHISFLYGKCRVAPLKPVHSIPRLELMAAVLCVQLATKLRRELPLHLSEYFWTDSTVVLGYIKNESARFKVFVANRVQRIHDGSQPEQWFHVDGSDNPADDGSRGVWSPRWLQGPHFLCNPNLVVQESVPVVSTDDVEVKCLSCQSDEIPDDGPFPVHTFLNWFSTLKVWAWILRFIHNCRGRKLSGDLMVGELEDAKFSILRLVQKSAFSDELQKLSGRNRLCRNSPLYKLDVLLGQDGLIRVGGRIQQSALSDDLKHPIVLPSNHEISIMIIQHYHKKIHHQGRGMTCSEIRSHGFWILKLQKLVKGLIHSCVTCSRLRGKPCEQKMADLPIDRLSPGPPFLFCGCDLFGHFMIKSGRHEIKRYGVIFTCLASRAVHLEVVHSLSSDSFLNAFRRFVSLRGPVRQLRCDQGTHFTGAKSELMKMGCDVVFNPPAASHRGGAWERLIGVARRVIEGVLCEQSSRLNDEGLVTVMAEVSSVVNSRPLSVQDISDPQSLEPLTPNHLLMLKSKVIPRTLSPLDTDRSDLYANKQWRRVQYLVDLFWSRWKREIVHQHMSRSKWNTVRQNVKVNDVVLLIDDQCHRSFWKMARVIAAIPSKDGLVRTVKLRLADRSVLERPVQKVVHLLSTVA